MADEELDEDGDESDGLPDEALRQQQRKMDSLEPPGVQMPPPQRVSPQPAPEKAAPTPYGSACGESFTSNESFQAHVLEKQRPSNPTFPTRPDVRSPSPVPPMKPNASSSEYNRLTEPFLCS